MLKLMLEGEHDEVASSGDGYIEFTHRNVHSLHLRVIEGDHVEIVHGETDLIHHIVQYFIFLTCSRVIMLKLPVAGLMILISLTKRS